MEKEAFLTALEIRQLMYEKFPKKIREDEVMEIIKREALKGNFEARIPQADFGGDVRLVRSYMGGLGYHMSIEFFHGYPREQWVLVIEW